MNNLLTKEFDRLNQYTRRSNLVFRNVFLHENESVQQVEKKVTDIIGKMGLPDIVADFDKAHRLGAVKEVNGKKQQDVIVRFKSHSSRYKIFAKRKMNKHISIRPNLTNARSKMLQEAVDLTKSIQNDDWGLVFANMHGDLLFRLKEKHEKVNSTTHLILLNP